MKAIAAGLVGAFALGASISGALAADGPDAIKARGTLVVGVKPDYRPFSFRDPSGTLVGIEPDLAADIAHRLGVKLQLVPVVSSNRMEFLQHGKVDLLIATISDTPERRKVVQAIDPQYYADFVNVLASKTSGIKDWADLKGKTVCATSGAWYNKAIAQSYGPNLLAFDGSEKPLFAMKQGNCVAYVYDQTFLQGRLLDDAWKADYAMPLKGIMETPWIMAVAKGNDGLAKVAAEATLDWAKSGFMVDEEKKWGLAPSSYTVTMHEKAGAKP